MYTQKISKTCAELDIYSLKTIPVIRGSRIVEHVPTYEESEGLEKTFEVRYMSPQRPDSIQWVNHSAIIQRSLSICLNSHWCWLLIDDIVRCGIRIAEKQAILNPGVIFLENQDLGGDFQNLLKKKIKYSTLYWVMSAKFTVGHADSKYYLKWTKDLQEVDALYTRFKTEYSERLLRDLQNQFSKYIDSLDALIVKQYTKFFEFSDYSPESIKEAIELQATILVCWYKVMNKKLEEINERLVKFYPEDGIKVAVEKFTDELFRKARYCVENPNEEYVELPELVGKNSGNSKDIDL
ncbi:MAG: hypothetical protein C5B43_03635 [Verrucomicrobia bacterium]|nr:MAG: hypothetical protein C5B43_03635 [Verrucomicrobiota bacterium]